MIDIQALTSYINKGSINSVSDWFALIIATGGDIAVPTGVRLIYNIHSENRRKIY